MVCHHLAKFYDHRVCGSRDIIFLVCHANKQEHVIKGSSDYNNGSPARHSTLCHHPAKFVGYRNCQGIS